MLVALTSCARRDPGGAASLNQFHDLLAEVPARKQADEGFGCSGQTLRYRFAVLDASCRDALREFLQCLRPEFQVLRDDEAAQGDARHEQSPHVVDRDILSVIAGNESAE